MASNSITEWGLRQVEQRGWDDYLWVGLIGVGIGFTIGWIAALAKLRAETGKIQEEARKVSGDNIEKLAASREKAISKRQVVDIAMQNLRDSLRTNQTISNIDKLRACRDELCSVYDTDYLPAVAGYTELIPVLTTRKEAHIRAQTELIPGLGTICAILELVNDSRLLSKISGAAPLKLKKARRDGIILRVKTLVPWWNFGLRWKIRKIRKRTDQHLRKE